MKIVALVGSHPRHFAFLSAIMRTGWLKGVILEIREEHVPSPEPRVPAALGSLFRTHFSRRATSEEHFFGEIARQSRSNVKQLPTLQVTQDELNSEDSRKFLSSLGPDLILSYGVHKVGSEILAVPGSRAWNLHGGLSPWYRGVMTHFWPSYFLEPQFTGMTLHETTSIIDSGPIIHQNGVELVRGDGLHDVACRAVQGMCEEIEGALALFERTGDYEVQPQPVTGRTWLNRDWSVDHLRVIYDYFDDRIVDMVLDGEIAGREPVLVRQQGLGLRGASAPSSP